MGEWERERQRGGQRERQRDRAETVDATPRPAEVRDNPNLLSAAEATCFTRSVSTFFLVVLFNAFDRV